MLYSRQPWLSEREDNFFELLMLCETMDHRNLIFHLLKEFHFLEERTLNTYLKLISDYIVNQSGFNEDTTQVAAITYDDEADSSQKVLDYIKMPLQKQGWASVKTVNRYGATIKNFNDGKTQIIFIDEFIGSGETILNRIKQIKADIRQDFELKFCFIAGMEFGIKKIEDLGYTVFCPLRILRGITDYFINDELIEMSKIMYLFESKLAQTIKEFKLSDFSFGYNNAEALYSLEGSRGNTPNSVFPIFWWPKQRNGKSRKTLLTRYQRGLK